MLVPRSGTGLFFEIPSLFRVPRDCFRHHGNRDPQRVLLLSLKYSHNCRVFSVSTISIRLQSLGSRLSTSFTEHHTHLPPTTSYHGVSSLQSSTRVLEVELELGFYQR